MAQFVGKAAVPDVLVFSHFAEVAILQGLAGCFVNDGLNEILLQLMVAFADH